MSSLIDTYFRMYFHVYYFRITTLSWWNHSHGWSAETSPTYTGGEVCFLEDAEAKLSLLYGRPVKLDEGFVRRKDQVPWRAFIGRWLNNLKHLYIQQQLPEETLTVIRMLRATRPDSIEEIRDEGLYLSQTGNFKCASSLLVFIFSLKYM